MPEPTPTVRTAAREAARTKLAGLFSGQLGVNVADEIADAVLDAAAGALYKQTLFADDCACVDLLRAAPTTQED